MIKIRLERSESMVETVSIKTGKSWNEIPSTRELTYDDTDGQWVQLTYETLRTQDGAPLLGLNDDDDWVDEDGELWSDVVISFEP